MVDFDDMDDGLEGSNVHHVDFAKIRKNAHVANGGDALFECPACHGSGMWRGRGHCFKCKGKGNVTKGVAAAAKAAVTRKLNIKNARQWFADAHVEEIAFILRMSEYAAFFASLRQQLDERGTLSERQVEVVRSAMVKKAERFEQRKAERAEAATNVGIDAINALFQTAMDNGLKQPIFRAKGLVIKPARQWVNRLYVTDSEQGGTYVGKIEDGMFHPRREARPETGALLCEIAEDPKKAAIEYGRSTGNCGCCGRTLTDPVSVANGIGPICESKWGM